MGFGYMAANEQVLNCKSLSATYQLKNKPSNRMYSHSSLTLLASVRLTNRGISPHRQALTLCAIFDDKSVNNEDLFVDSFTNQKFKGNPAAVLLLPKAI